MKKRGSDQPYPRRHALWLTAPRCGVRPNKPIRKTSPGLKRVRNGAVDQTYKAYWTCTTSNPGRHPKRLLKPCGVRGSSQDFEGSVGPCHPTQQQEVMSGEMKVRAWAWGYSSPISSLCSGVVTFNTITAATWGRNNDDRVNEDALEDPAGGSRYVGHTGGTDWPVRTRFYVDGIW